MKLSDILKESLIFESVTFWLPSESKYGLGDCPYCDDGMDGVVSKVGNHHFDKEPRKESNVTQYLAQYDEKIVDLFKTYEAGERFYHDQPSEENQRTIRNKLREIRQQIDDRHDELEKEAKKIFKGGFKKVDCQACEGTGEFEQRLSDAPELNVSNTNARVVIDILGLEFDYAGTIKPEQIPALKRRLIQFKNTSNAADAYTRDTTTSQDSRMVKTKGDDGVTKIEPRKGPTMIDVGLSPERVQSYVDRLMPILDYAQKKNVKISWG